MGLFGKLEVLGKDKQSCKINSILMGRSSTPITMACKTLTGEQENLFYSYKVYIPPEWHV